MANPNHAVVYVAALLWLSTMPTGARADSPTLSKIRSSGTLSLGYRESSIPFSYLGPNQKPVGISIDLCQAITEKLKAQLKLPDLKVRVGRRNIWAAIPEHSQQKAAPFGTAFPLSAAIGRNVSAGYPRE